MGGGWGDLPLQVLKLAKLSKKNGIKLVGYTFRLKNYVRIPPVLSDFSDLMPPLDREQVTPNTVFPWLARNSTLAFTPGFYHPSPQNRP